MSIAVYEIYGKPNQACLIVGLGLVGGAVSHQMSMYCTLIDVLGLTRVDWKSPKQLIDHVNHVLPLRNYEVLEVIWCAGKAGFAASDSDMALEHEYFVSAIKAFAAVPNTKLTVNLISSAGGLYEAGGFVQDVNDVSPERPYGFWKLKLENVLVEHGIAHRVYRASSIYGLGSLNIRLGLINRLLLSASFDRQIEIYADQNTMRDYIYNVDVAKSIVSDILCENPVGVKILASGRATSVGTLLNLVQAITKKTVRATFHLSRSNDKDIFFGKNLIESNLIVTSMEESLRVMNSKLLL